MDNSLKKILIIDDEQDVVTSVKNELIAKQYTVDISYNGKEGFDKMRDATESDNSHDLIILEILIPALNGMEVCKEMRRDESLSQIPVLMISILPLNSKEFKYSLDTKDELKVVKGVLQKPFSNEELMVEVKKILGN